MEPLPHDPKLAKVVLEKAGQKVLARKARMTATVIWNIVRATVIMGGATLAVLYIPNCLRTCAAQDAEEDRTRLESAHRWVKAHKLEAQVDCFTRVNTCDVIPATGAPFQISCNAQLCALKSGQSGQ
jgi:hypothetical protein